MQEDPSRNKYICIINEQTNNSAPNPYDLQTRGLRLNMKESCKSRNKYTDAY